MYKPYSIRSPQFDTTSGGIRVLYGLYGWLLAKGQIAYLNTIVQGTESIGIYPEIYRGNELGASKVVRYILQKPGVMGTTDQYGSFSTGPTKFNSDDEIYVFSKIYDTFEVSNSHLLFLPIINTHIFKDLHKKRTKTCYLVGKGVNTNQHPKDAIELTRQFATNQTAFSELLNECKMLYGYDHMSAAYDIARLCGCPVTYFGSGSQLELRGYEPGLQGIDFGEGSEFNPHAFRMNYQGLIDKFSIKLDRFITETQRD